MDNQDTATLDSSQKESSHLVWYYLNTSLATSAVVYSRQSCLMMYRILERQMIFIDEDTIEIEALKTVKNITNKITCWEDENIW